MQAQDFPDEVELEVLLSNGKWIAWNGNEATHWARSWYSTTTPAISICTKNGGMETVDIRGNKFNGANNMSTWGDDKDNIMFYSRYGSADAIYEVMVEKGWYIKAVMFDFNCSNDKGAKDGSITVRLEDADEATSEDINDDQHVEWETMMSRFSPPNSPLYVTTVHTTSPAPATSLLLWVIWVPRLVPQTR